MPTVRNTLKDSPGFSISCAFRDIDLSEQTGGISDEFGLVGEDGVPAKKRSSIHLEVKGDVLDNDAMGGHIKGAPVQGGGEGPDAIVLSPPQNSGEFAQSLPADGGGYGH